MDNEKPGFWAILPAVVRYDKTISPMSRLLYAEISALCDKDGVCKAGNPYFVRVFEISTRQLSRLFQELESAGHIHVKIDKIHGNKREITLSYTKTGVKPKMSIAIDKNDHRVSSKMSIAIDKNGTSLICNNNKEINNKEVNMREREPKKTEDAPAHVSPVSNKMEKERGELQTFGEFENVSLSDVEMGKLSEFLKASFPTLNGNCQAALQEYIEAISAWQASHQKSYSNHYAEIRRWILRDRQRGTIPGVAVSAPTKAKKQSSYEEDMALLASL